MILDTPAGVIRFHKRFTEPQIEAMRRLINDGANPDDIADVLQGEYHEISWEPQTTTGSSCESASRVRAHWGQA